MCPHCRKKPVYIRERVSIGSIQKSFSTWVGGKKNRRREKGHLARAAAAAACVNWPSSHSKDS